MPEERPPKVLMRPRTIARLNGLATVVWLCLVVPTVLIWKSSILWVALMSIWANVVSHYTAWRVAKDEVRTERVEKRQ